MSIVEQARDFAIDWHGDQKYGVHPYVKHLDDVAHILRFYSDDVLTIAYLHDVLEDTKCPEFNIQSEFGQEVLQCVRVLTDRPGNTREERKAATYARLARIDGGHLHMALIVKAADRMANVQACLKEGNRRLLEVYWEEHVDFMKAVGRPLLNSAMMLHITDLLMCSGVAGDGPIAQSQESANPFKVGDRFYATQPNGLQRPVFEVCRVEGDAVWGECFPNGNKHWDLEKIK